MKKLPLILALIFSLQLSAQDKSINGKLNIRSSWGNSHIPFADGNVYLTGYSGSGGYGTFVYRTYNGSVHSEIFVIKPSARVGIGITNPSTNLEIQGSDINLPIVRLRNASWQCNQEMAIEFWNGSHYKTVPTSRIVSKMSGCGNGGEDLLFQTQSYSDSNPNLNSPTTKFIIKNNGEIGFSTSSPRGRFDVSSSGDKYLTSSTENVTTAEDLFLPGHIYFAPTTNGDQVYIQARRKSNSGSTKFNFRTYNNGSINDAALFIDANANVGIGITNPSHKLTVAGTISATEVKVSTTPNSDFVFEPEYQLRPLEEVDAFIRENKHLPDIPSAAEFKENGVGLGEMDNMLLQKIEELTLYVIEQGKKLEAQDKEIAELKNLVEDFQSKEQMPER
jgi:hypothetical protein